MITNSHILFMVEMGNIHYLCFATDREDAKRQAHAWIGGNADHYIVSPLTGIGDRLHISLTIAV